MPTEKIKHVQKLTPLPPEPVGIEEGQYFSRAVAKAFSLLQILGRSEEPLSLGTLSTQIKLTKSSTFRLLYTLESLHHILQEEDGRYSLPNESRSNGFQQIASVIVPIAREHMHALQMQFKETVSLAVLFNNHIEVVDVLESPHIVRMANTIGRILPPHASSLGKAVTAFQPEAIAQKLFKSYGLPRLTSATITDEFHLAEEMQKIRARGFSTETEESVLDGCCFGSPIFLVTSAAVGAMSISMPKSRVVMDERRVALTDALREATQRISAKLREVL